MTWIIWINFCTLRTHIHAVERRCLLLIYTIYRLITLSSFSLSDVCYLKSHCSLNSPKLFNMKMSTIDVGELRSWIILSSAVYVNLKCLKENETFWKQPKQQQQNVTVNNVVIYLVYLSPWPLLCFNKRPLYKNDSNSLITSTTISNNRSKKVFGGPPHAFTSTKLIKTSCLTTLSLKHNKLTKSIQYELSLSLVIVN